MTILSGLRRSSMAVPSAKNYGLLVKIYLFLFYGIELELMIFFKNLAVPIGTVDFSTIIKLLIIFYGFLL